MVADFVWDDFRCMNNRCRVRQKWGKKQGRQAVYPSVFGWFWRCGCLSVKY